MPRRAESRYGVGHPRFLPRWPMSSEPAAANHQPVRVWDLPTRLFHWVLAAAVIGLVITGKIGGNALIWHFRLGYLVMGLLIFRLLWGLVGGHWSRFASFIYGPGTVLRYLRGQARREEHLEVGHNPLGAFSVFALLGFLIVQVGTGLVADDEIANVGPLNRYVSSGTAGTATHWHRDYGQWILITLVVVHLAAIAYYFLRHGNNLVGPMIDGDKPLAVPAPSSQDGIRQRLVALVLGVLCAVVVWWVSRLGG